MGELLRAVLDKSCKYSRPAWYTIDIICPALITTSTLTGVLQCKADRWFLMTNYTVDAIVPSGVGFSNTSENLQLIDPQNTKRFSLSPIIDTLFGGGGNENGLMTENQYYLWEPSSLIQVEFSENPNDGVPLTTYQNWTINITLGGIEYAR